MNFGVPWESNVWRVFVLNEAGNNGLKEYNSHPRKEKKLTGSQACSSFIQKSKQLPRSSITRFDKQKDPNRWQKYSKKFCSIITIFLLLHHEPHRTALQNKVDWLKCAFIINAQNGLHLHLWTFFSLIHDFRKMGWLFYSCKRKQGP